MDSKKEKELDKLIDQAADLDIAMEGKFFEPIIEHALLMYRRELVRKMLLLKLGD